MRAMALKDGSLLTLLPNNIYFPRQENTFDRLFESRRCPRPAPPPLPSDEAKRAVAPGLRCGTRCQPWPRFFHQKGLIKFSVWLPATFYPFDQRDGSPLAFIRPRWGMCKTWKSSAERSFLQVWRKGVWHRFRSFMTFLFSGVEAPLLIV